MYNINELATITGLTTRTLRSYLKLGILDGEKVDGVWLFTKEDVSRFLADKTVKPSLQAKRNAPILDFLADLKKPANQLCVILDLAISPEEAQEVSTFFCNAVNQCPSGCGVKMNFQYEGSNARVNLTGPEDLVQKIMAEYYK